MAVAMWRIRVLFSVDFIFAIMVAYTCTYVLVHVQNIFWIFRLFFVQILWLCAQIMKKWKWPTTSQWPVSMMETVGSSCGPVRGATVAPAPSIQVHCSLWLWKIRYTEDYYRQVQFLWAEIFRDVLPLLSSSL